MQGDGSSVERQTAVVLVRKAPIRDQTAVQQVKPRVACRSQDAVANNIRAKWALDAQSGQSPPFSPTPDPIWTEKGA